MQEESRDGSEAYEGRKIVPVSEQTLGQPASGVLLQRIEPFPGFLRDGEIPGVARRGVRREGDIATLEPTKAVAIVD